MIGGERRELRMASRGSEGKSSSKECAKELFMGAAEVALCRTEVGMRKK